MELNFFISILLKFSLNLGVCTHTNTQCESPRGKKKKKKKKSRFFYSSTSKMFLENKAIYVPICN